MQHASEELGCTAQIQYCVGHHLLARAIAVVCYNGHQVCVLSDWLRETRSVLSSSVYYGHLYTSYLRALLLRGL